MKTRAPLRQAIVLAFALAAGTARAVAQVPDTLKYSFFDPDTALQTGAQQGWSVASNGDFVVVGAPFDDDIGLVRVYHAVTGALLQTIANPRPTQSDYFGSAVAISGSRVVVGARGSDVGGEDRGRAYVYDLASAAPTVPVLTLNNPDDHIQSDNHNFGFSVAIAGQTVVIGAIYASVAYVYDLASATPETPVVTLNNPGSEVILNHGEEFGNIVAIDGTRVAIGARFDNYGSDRVGSVFVYELTSATPAIPLHVLRNPSPGGFDDFAGGTPGLLATESSLAISGTRVLVGAYQYSERIGRVYYVRGRAYLFDLASATSETPVLTIESPFAGRGAIDQPPGTATTAITESGFGVAVAISGTRFVIGSYADVGGIQGAGRAFLYDIMSPSPTARA